MASRWLALGLGLSLLVLLGARTYSTDIFDTPTRLVWLIDDATAISTGDCWFAHSGTNGVGCTTAGRMDETIHPMSDGTYFLDEVVCLMTDATGWGTDDNVTFSLRSITTASVQSSVLASWTITEGTDASDCVDTGSSINACSFDVNTSFTLSGNVSLQLSSTAIGQDTGNNLLVAGSCAVYLR